MPTIVIPKSVEDKQKEEAKRLGYEEDFIIHDVWDDGRTATIIRLKNSKEAHVGMAICSTKDQFCKRTGRVIARGRALKKVKQARVMGG